MEKGRKVPEEFTTRKRFMALGDNKLVFGTDSPPNEMSVWIETVEAMKGASIWYRTRSGRPGQNPGRKSVKTPRFVTCVLLL